MKLSKNLIKFFYVIFNVIILINLHKLRRFNEVIGR